MKPLNTRVAAVAATLPLHVAALVGLSTCVGVLLAPATAQAAGACVVGQTTEGTVSLTAKRVALGGQLTITGTGWCDNLGTGSRIGVKIDEGGISHLTTAVHTNKSIWAIVQADADGTFTAQIPMPDGTKATSSPALATGEHSLRLLSGSLKDPGLDQGRTVLSENFTVTQKEVVTPAAPSWPNQEIPAGTATVWVEDSVTTGDTATVRVKGHGWVKGDGTASTVAVKLSSGTSTQYVRPTGEVITHPTAAGDNTIWALFVPGTSSQSHVFTINADGTFEATLDLPRGLVDGQYLSVSLSSGRFATGDVQRSVTSKPLVVGTARGVEEQATGGKCTTKAQPSVSIDTPTVAPGGVLRISGAGWCHPKAGGSKIGIKIDEGAYSHLDASVHSNQTIWAIVEADNRTGTFTADITLPDGTTATSDPALPRGAHTLRLLSGSLKPGDATRTLLSDPFVIGSYRPNGYPDPIDAASLGRSNRGGVTITRSGRELRVRVPGGQRGDWVHLSAYLPNSSPTFPWGDRWYRLDARGRLTVTLPRTAPEGPVKVVVTDGNQTSFGDLLGWDRARFPKHPKKPDEQPGKGTTQAPQPAQPTVTPAAPVVALVASAVDTPLTEPAAPAKNFVALGVLPDGGLDTSLRGTTLTVTFPQAQPGDLVHTRVYGADDVPAGWGTLAADRTLQLDLAKLPAGTYRIAFQDRTGKLLGWTEVAWQMSDEAEPVAPTADEVSEVVTVTPAGATWAPAALDGILLGVGAAAVGLTSLVRRRKGGVA